MVGAWEGDGDLVRSGRDRGGAVVLAAADRRRKADVPGGADFSGLGFGKGEAPELRVDRTSTLVVASSGGSVSFRSPIGVALCGE